MNILFEKIKTRVLTIESIVKKRNWVLRQKPIIEPPALPTEVNILEEKLKKRLPTEFKELLLHFSRQLEFNYQFEEEIPLEFAELFSGEIYWNTKTLIEQFDDFNGWIEASLDPITNDEESIEITKKFASGNTPLMSVPNGDLIVIDDQSNEVYYLDHEGDTMHGKRLGKSLFEFLDKWSQFGFIGTEGWQLEEFYDFENNSLIDIDSPKAQRWINWFYKT